MVLRKRNCYLESPYLIVERERNCIRKYEAILLRLIKLGPLKVEKNIPGKNWKQYYVSKNCYLYIKVKICKASINWFLIRLIIGNGYITCIM